jgi:two-component system sensor histidine kinase KdpD
VLSVLLLDFFFVPPYLSFSVADFQHVVMFGVMFVVAGVISGLTRRIRLQADAARYRERRTAMLYSMSRELSGTRATRDLASVAVQHVREVFEAKVALLLAANEGRLKNVASGDGAFLPEEKERDVVDWVLSHGKPAGLSTETLPFARALYAPLHGGQGPLGVLGVLPNDARRFSDPEQRALLDVFANQIASALERAHWVEQVHPVHGPGETDGARNSPSGSDGRDLRAALSPLNRAAAGVNHHHGVAIQQARDEEEQ